MSHQDPWGGPSRSNDKTTHNTAPKPLCPFDTALLLIIEQQKGSMIRRYFCVDAVQTATSVPQDTELPPCDQNNLSRQMGAALVHYRVRLDE